MSDPTTTPATAPASGRLVDRFITDLPDAVRHADDQDVGDRDTDRDRPFLSVITRTTGSRASIVDTLTCLAAQTDDDLEVLLMVNTIDRSSVDAVLSLVETFHEGFRQRVRVDVSTEPHRVHPLNRGLDQARGRYVTVLDDDDLVFADWVEQFRRVAKQHPGAIIRCRAVDQDAAAIDGSPLGVTATATSGFDVAYRPAFDLASHLAGGQSPQGSVCFPVDELDEFELRFDPTMVVCEDLEFLLRAAVLCGVVDTGTFGLVYRRWTATQSSAHTVDAEVWEESMREVVRRLDAGPLLTPEGTASRLYQAAVQERRLFDLDQGTDRLLHRVEVAERNWAAGAHNYGQLEREHLLLVDDRERWRSRAENAERLLDEASRPPVPRRVMQAVRRRLSDG
jgi:hypothetical protein